MTLVSGASQFLNQAALASVQGVSALDTATNTSLLSGFDSTISLLEIGKQFGANGIGLSASSRALTNQYLTQSQSAINTILSAGAQNTIDGARTQILALQSSLPTSAIGSFAARDGIDENGNIEGQVDDNPDDGGISASEDTGTVLDTEA